jgi:hypothetical protein
MTWIKGALALAGGDASVHGNAVRRYVLATADEQTFEMANS